MLSCRWEEEREKSIMDAIAHQHEELIRQVVESIREESDDFVWCPSLDEGQAYTKEELIREVEEQSEIGVDFIGMLMSATTRFLQKDSKRRR